MSLTPRLKHIRTGLAQGIAFVHRSTVSWTDIATSHKIITKKLVDQKFGVLMATGALSCTNDLCRVLSNLLNLIGYWCCSTSFNYFTAHSLHILPLMVGE